MKYFNAKGSFLDNHTIKAVSKDGREVSKVNLTSTFGRPYVYLDSLESDYNICEKVRLKTEIIQEDVPNNRQN